MLNDSDYDVARPYAWTAGYEPRHLPPGATALQPPAGTPCFLVFAANANRTPWVMAFTGWPP
jgi:hypothetical protein